jgi:hypothetical protein
MSLSLTNCLRKARTKILAFFRPFNSRNYGAKIYVTVVTLCNNNKFNILDIYYSLNYM